MKKQTLFVVQAALIAALYAALTYAQALLLPGSASAAVQFRVSEILCITALYTPAAIPGLTLGCMIANISSISLLGPYDIIFGSAATLLTAVCIYLFRNVRIKKLPILPLLMPAIFNGVIVGWEIETFFVAGKFHIAYFLVTGGCVALGELGVLMVLGLPFSVLLEKRGLDKVIFGSFSD